MNNGSNIGLKLLKTNLNKYKGQRCNLTFVSDRKPI